MELCPRVETSQSNLGRLGTAEKEADRDSASARLGLLSWIKVVVLACPADWDLRISKYHPNVQTASSWWNPRPGSAFNIVVRHPLPMFVASTQRHDLLSLTSSFPPRVPSPRSLAHLTPSRSEGSHGSSSSDSLFWNCDFNRCCAKRRGLPTSSITSKSLSLLSLTACLTKVMGTKDSAGR